MPYYIGGSSSDSIRILVLNESNYTLESNFIVNEGNWSEVVSSGSKIVVGLDFEGRMINGYSQIDPIPTSSGIFSDAPVDGVAYSCSPSNITGVTIGGGIFYYLPGDEVTFKMGNITLGTVSGAASLSPIDLVPAASGTDHQAVQNMARLLQSIDENNSPNASIKIPNWLIAYCMQLDDIDFDVSTSTFTDNTAVSDILDQFQDDRELVTAEKAADRLDTAVNGPSWTGISSYPWTITDGGSWNSQNSRWETTNPGGIITLQVNGEWNRNLRSSYFKVTVATDSGTNACDAMIYNSKGQQMNDGDQCGDGCGSDTARTMIWENMMDTFGYAWDSEDLDIEYLDLMGPTEGEHLYISDVLFTSQETDSDWTWVDRTRDSDPYTGNQRFWKPVGSEVAWNGTSWQFDLLDGTTNESIQRACNWTSGWEPAQIALTFTLSEGESAIDVDVYDTNEDPIGSSNNYSSGDGITLTFGEYDLDKIKISLNGETSTVVYVTAIEFFAKDSEVRYPVLPPQGSLTGQDFWLLDNGFITRPIAKASDIFPHTDSKGHVWNLEYGFNPFTQWGFSSGYTRCDFHDSVSEDSSTDLKVTGWISRELASIPDPSQHAGHPYNTKDIAEAAEAHNWMRDNIIYLSDQENYGLVDYWATSTEVIARGKDDCDGQAIACWRKMRDLNLPDLSIGIVIIKSDDGRGHAIAGYWPNSL